MPRGFKFSQKEAAEKIRRHHGYVLKGEYLRKDRAVLVRCDIHDFEKHVLPSNLFKGTRMACCGMVVKRERLRTSMTGEGNPFFGKKHSIITREKLSAAGRSRPQRRMPPSFGERIAARQRGVPRTATVRAKLSEHFKRRYKIFEYCVRNAERGKTSGKPGVFYIVKIGDKLKFGSATTTMHYRLVRYRQTHGDAVVLQGYCLVPDAGAYEAAMMRAHRQYWLHGEYFRDFREDGDNYVGTEKVETRRVA